MLRSLVYYDKKFKDNRKRVFSTEVLVGEQNYLLSFVGKVSGKVNESKWLLAVLKFNATN